jgi:hypothetical protein
MAVRGNTGKVLHSPALNEVGSNVVYYVRHVKRQGRAYHFVKENPSSMLPIIGGRACNHPWSK